MQGGSREISPQPTISLRLGEHSDKPKQIILQGKQRSDEHDAGEEQPVLDARPGILDDRPHQGFGSESLHDEALRDLGVPQANPDASKMGKLMAQLLRGLLRRKLI